MAGGKIGFSRGTFALAAAIAANVADVNLVGSGWATILRPSASASCNCITVTAEECKIADLMIEGNAANQTSGYGIAVNGVNRTRIVDVLIEDTIKEGIYVYGNASWTIIDRCIVRGTHDDCITITAANETQIINTLAGFVNDPTAHYALLLSNAQQTTVTHGFFDRGLSGCYVYNSDNCKFNGCQFEISEQHGLAIGGNSSNNIVTGCTVRDNSKKTTNGYSGIYLSSTASYNLIQANSVWNDSDYDATYGTERHKYSIDISAAGCVGNIVVNNQLNHLASSYANGTAVLHDSGTGSVIRDNIGWVTEAKGTSKIDSGQTTVNVTHGLSATPTVINVTFAEAGTNDYGRWWISSAGATTFTVNVSGDPGSSNLDFWWEAKVR